MQLKNHVSHEFMLLPTDKKITFGSGVVNSLGDNAPTFPALPVTIVALDAANELLHDTYIAFVKNGDSAKGDFFNAEFAWKTKFTNTANYVDNLADGDLSIIDKSGFDNTARNSVRSKILGALKNFMSHGNSKVGSGVVTSSVEDFAGLKAYLFTLAHSDAIVTTIDNQVTVSMAGVVVYSYKLNTRSSVNFTGLTSLTKMNAQAAAFNTAGIGAFTQTVEVTVP